MDLFRRNGQRDMSKGAREETCDSRHEGNSRASRVHDEGGAVLILALVFLLIVGGVVGVLANWTTNDLNNTAKFTAARSLQSAANSATQVAIKEAEQRTQAVESQLVSTPAQTMSQVRTSENQFLMQQLKTTLLNLELKRTELLAKFEPDYRPVQEVQQQIEQTLDAITKAEKSPVREETTDRNPSYD